MNIFVKLEKLASKMRILQVFRKTENNTLEDVDKFPLKLGDKLMDLTNSSREN